jgi:hypothetical protein
MLDEGVGMGEENDHHRPLEHSSITKLEPRASMRAIAAVLLMLSALSLCAGQANAGSGCAHYARFGIEGGGTNCGFYSNRHCMTALWGGGGGFCSNNPGWTGTNLRGRRGRH